MPETPQTCAILVLMRLDFLSPFLVSMFLGGKSEIVGGVVTVGWLAASAGWIYHAFQYNGKVWPSLKATWDNSFLCNRCNEMFCLGN